MLRDYKKTLKIFLVFVSVLVLIVPDLLLHLKPDFYRVITIVSKLCLFLAAGLILLRITKSFFFTYLFIGIPTLISAMPEILNVFALDWYLNTDGMKAVFFTSKNEVVEFYQKFNVFFLVPIGVLVGYLFFVWWYKNVNFSIKTRLLIPVAFMLLLISVSISVLRMSQTSYFYSDKNKIKWVFNRYYIEEFPLNFYYRVYHLYAINKRNREYKKHKEKFQFEAKSRSSHESPDVVVFIIGEAMRYANWTVNGYEKETCPGLMKINNLISYHNHYSNANSTSNSIPLLITQAEPSSFNEAYYQKSVVSLFKEAEYETTWITSCSDVLNYLDNFDEPDTVVDLQLIRNEHIDLEIVPSFERVISQTSGIRKFIVINMRGGHDKPPKDFIVFKPNSSENKYPLSIQNAEIFRNDYDNMIRFQDYVLSGLINRLEQEDLSSVLLFTSDHATHLFDQGHSLFGYGSANPTSIETHIPLFVWASDRYINQNDAKYSNLRDRRDSHITNDHLFYLLADMANINYKFFDKTKSLADSSYAEPTTRYVYTTEGVFEFYK